MISAEAIRRRIPVGGASVRDIVAKYAEPGALEPLSARAERLLSAVRSDSRRKLSAVMGGAAPEAGSRDSGHADHRELAIAVAVILNEALRPGLREAQDDLKKFEAACLGGNEESIHAWESALSRLMPQFKENASCVGHGGEEARALAVMAAVKLRARLPAFQSSFEPRLAARIGAALGASASPADAAGDALASFDFWRMREAGDDLPRESRALLAMAEDGNRRALARLSIRLRAGHLNREQGLARRVRELSRAHDDERRRLMEAMSSFLLRVWKKRAILSELAGWHAGELLAAGRAASAEAFPDAERISCEGNRGRTFVCRPHAGADGRAAGYAGFDPLSREFRGRPLRAFYGLDGTRLGRLERHEGGWQVVMGEPGGGFVTAPETIAPPP